MHSKFSYSEQLQFNRLCDTFSLNFKVTQLYSTYLEHFPEIITKDIIEALTEDGSIKIEDAIPALLGEIFGLDTEKNDTHRQIMREYIIPSIRILHTKKYTENLYYKNIKLPDIKDGDWEFKNEKYTAYRAVICDDMIIKNDFTEIPPLGFFTEDFEFPAVLEGGNEWMTLTPVDLDTCEEAIALANGKVITFGLGLGYYAYMVSEKDEVTSITVVEKSEKVIELFKKYVLPQFSHPEKVRIINADAFEYAEEQMPKENYTLAFVDTWRDASDGAPMWARMKKLEYLSKNTKFLYWIENFLISRRRAIKFADIKESYDSGKLDTGYEQIMNLLTKTEELIK